MDNKLSNNLSGRGDQNTPGEVTRKRSFFHIIQQSEEFRSLINKIPEAIIITDLEGNILHLNSEAKSLFHGLAKDPESATWPKDFCLYLDDGLTPYPDEKLPVALARQGQAKENEEMILSPNEKTSGIWITMSAQPLQHADGTVEGVLTCIRDISYRKQIELSRQKHIQRTEALYKLSHYITEAGNNLHNLTRSVANFTSEVIGDLSLIAIKDSQDDVKIAAFSERSATGQALMRKVVVSNDKIDKEKSVIAGVIKSGEPLLVPSMASDQVKAITQPALKDYIDQVGIGSFMIVPIVGRSGVLGAIAMSRHRGHKAYQTDEQSFLMDIASRTALAIENCRLFESLRNEVAERLSTKQRLDSSEERFRAIFEATTLGIKVLDLDGNILQTNAAYQRMIGYSNAELFGRHFADFLYEEDVPRAMKVLKDLKVSNITQQLFEHRAIARDDSVVWVKTIFSPVHTGNGNKKLAYIVGILENVTEQKRIEMQMKEMRDRLQSNIELERLRLAQELHDNPMQSLYSVIYRVEELRAKADPSLNDDFKKVTEEVQNVLNALRATAQELRPPTIFDFGLENAIRSYVDDFGSKHSDLKISLSLAQDRQMLPENIRLALFRIFQQSLMNVVRHADATEVKVRFAFDAEEVRLEISDNGKGFEVPPTWMEFVRAGHYGLAGASERVDSLGGMMVVESEPGNTTIVKVTVPWKELQ